MGHCVHQLIREVRYFVIAVCTRNVLLVEPFCPGLVSLRTEDFRDLSPLNRRHAVHPRLWNMSAGAWVFSLGWLANCTLL